MNWPEVKMAGLLAALGLPAWTFLTTGDNEERVLMVAAARRALDVRETLDRNLAAYTIDTLSKALRRG